MIDMLAARSLIFMEWGRRFGFDFHPIGTLGSRVHKSPVPRGLRLEC